jgi:glycosyltransferase involved in cell wall biosynthesis
MTEDISVTRRAALKVAAVGVAAVTGSLAATRDWLPCSNNACDRRLHRLSREQEAHTASQNRPHNGINPKAEIRGWVAADKVFEEIAEARCLVLPSLWYEPGLLVIAEARSLGVPVIIARITGPASWIVDGEDGLLIDGCDVDALAMALSHMSDDETATAMGSAAYGRYWADPLTTARHVSRTIGVYRSIMPGSISSQQVS